MAAGLAKEAAEKSVVMKAEGEEAAEEAREETGETEGTASNRITRRHLPDSECAIASGDECTRHTEFSDKITCESTTRSVVSFWGIMNGRFLMTPTNSKQRLADTDADK